MGLIMLVLAAARAKVAYLYTLGTEAVAWVTGYADGGVNRTKEADHLSIATSSADESWSEGAYATDATVDLTDYAALKVDWERTGTASEAQAVLVAATTQGAQGAINGVAWVIKNDVTFGRTISSIDISAISGSYYVRVHGRSMLTGSIEATSYLKVYKVYLQR